MTTWTTRWTTSRTRMPRRPPLGWGLPLLLVLGVSTLASGSLTTLDTDFQPTVTGICQPGLMKIQVNFNQSFAGIVHSRGLNPKSDYRKPPCVVQGNGSNSITLTVDLFTPPESPDYCGIQVDPRSEERKLNIAVRIHKTLELADDKFYKISCGTTKYKNTRNETSLVALRVLEHDGSKRTQNAYKNELYKLRVEITPFDEYKEDFKVKSCLGFDSENRNITIIDDRGCPYDKGILITNFVYDREHGTADAVMKMFRWSPDQKQLHLQCEVLMCRGDCVEPACDADGAALASLKAAGRQEEEAAYAHLTTGTSVYILEPGDPPVASASCEDGRRSQWLMYLAIALGALLLIMFIINVFLCSAMTCSCARTEIIEKEPSIIEDYDPYRSWHGSQYGSRFDSLRSSQNHYDNRDFDHHHQQQQHHHL